jgi:sugar phosphate isomerase/epimerase
MPAHVRIHRQAKTAMQSGRANTNRWVVEFEPEAPRRVEPLMGWTSSADTKGQVRLWFDTREEAVAYAEKHGYMFTLETPHERHVQPKAYAENFSYNRLGPWTH